jgi:hypothetical protein
VSYQFSSSTRSSLLFIENVKSWNIPCLAKNANADPIIRVCVMTGNCFHAVLSQVLQGFLLVMLIHIPHDIVDIDLYGIKP